MRKTIVNQVTAGITKDDQVVVRLDEAATLGIDPKEVSVAVINKRNAKNSQIGLFEKELAAALRQQGISPVRVGRCGVRASDIVREVKTDWNGQGRANPVKLLAQAIAELCASNLRVRA